MYHSDMTYQLTYTCTVDTSIDALFDFHTDTRNLLRITPLWVDVSIVSVDKPLREQSLVVLRIKRFGVTSLWQMRIETFNRPYMLCDSMIKGPFATFKHERAFSALTEDRTQMHETITCSLPFGILGWLVWPWVRRDMDAMFAYRQRATMDYFLNAEN